MQIREAAPGDLPGIKRLYAYLNPDDPVLDDKVATEIFNQILEVDRLHLFVGVLKEELVCSCYLNVVPNLSRNGAPYAVIENVVTDSEHRNRGLGKSIIKHALQYAWDLGCYKVMLQTGSRRESTHNFYKACGFDADEKFAFVAHPENWK